MLTLAEKNAWLTALRSGEFKQGYGYLCRVDRVGELYYCCLGVLCEVLKLHKSPPNSITGEVAFSTDQTTWAAKFLPRSIQNQAGLSQDGMWGSPALVRGSRIKGSGSLSNANDYGVTFSEIADFLEVNLLTEG